VLSTIRRTPRGKDLNPLILQLNATRCSYRQPEHFARRKPFSSRPQQMVKHRTHRVPTPVGPCSATASKNDSTVSRQPGRAPSLQGDDGYRWRFLSVLGSRWPRVSMRGIAAQARDQRIGAAARVDSAQALRSWSRHALIHLSGSRMSTSLRWPAPICPLHPIPR